MKYMGSKARHAKELLPIILKDRKPGQWYVEPFVGGANMIDKVDGPRIGNDLHQHLIAMWQAVSEGWLPPRFVSEDDYQRAKEAAKINAETGYIGFALSFGGSWFSSYRHDRRDQKGDIENMETQSRRAYESMLKQAKALAGVAFTCQPYQVIDVPPNSIIYCDPPYAGTAKYKTGEFNHDVFWQWCRDKVFDGHRVFVSEYNAPNDWICVWEKIVTSSLASNGQEKKKETEKLFIHESQV